LEKVGVSVIIPAYNEENRISSTIQRIWEHLQGGGLKFEIIVVDDGSRDSTAPLVRGLAERLTSIRLLSNERNMGKGFSIRKGILSAHGEWMLISDADLSTPIEELEKLTPYLSEHDIVIGSRGLRESDIALKQPWYREWMGKTFNLLVRLVVMGGIKDTQCGFKLFKGEVARRVFGLSRIQGFSFDVEVLFIARKLGYRTMEVPVRWLNSPASRVSVLSDPVKMFSDLFRIRLNWIMGLYRD
jgi:dolichyl-phosphate beta-glucosyltransferase